LAGAVVLAAAAVAGCTGDDPGLSTSASTADTPTVSGRCGHFSIAYDPDNGYEVSAFIVATLARNQLGCDVTMVKTTPRDAWRLVATGAADVYMDAYGVNGLRAKVAGPEGPVTVVGPNGVRGTVTMLAPSFMGDRGLDTARDLADEQEIGWGTTSPAITTVPELMALARSFLEFQHLDYGLRNFNDVGVANGMGGLMQQPRRDDVHRLPNVYLVAGPRGLLGERPGQTVVDVPGSAAQPCRPSSRSTLCSFDDFSYDKIANSAFTSSGSPAYALVYNYRLDPASVATLLELVTLSGYHVGPADVVSWLNTHAKVWRRWLPDVR
jgi:glycine betaine/proline transport system substrate-binding protein